MADAGLKFFQFVICEGNIFPFMNLQAMDQLTTIDLLVLGNTKNLFLDSAIIFRMEQVKMYGLRRRCRKYLNRNRDESKGNSTMRNRSTRHRKIRALRDLHNYSDQPANRFIFCEFRCGNRHE